MTIAVLDIETIPKYFPALEEELAKTVKAPSNWKDEDKIVAYKKEKVEKELDGIHFKPDGADVVCVGLGIIDPKELDVTNIVAKCSPLTDELCKFFCDYLNHFRVTKLVGCNIEGFDLPIMMSAVAKTPYYVSKPISKWGVVDLMHIQKRRDNMTRRVKGTWNSLCRLYGVEEPSKDGSMVKEMWENEQYTEIEDYCKEDVRAEGELYLRMTKIVEL